MFPVCMNPFVIIRFTISYLIAVFVIGEKRQRGPEDVRGVVVHEVKCLSKKYMC